MAVPPVVDQNFNPRAPCGARRASFSRRLRAYLFQPTRPLRGATILGLGPGPSSSRRFQPTRPLRGATVLCGGDGQWLNYFNPRAPCGARHGGVVQWSHVTLYFNPRAPCGARRADGMRFKPCEEISTHAPLAGRDTPARSASKLSHISTHAPLAGRDRSTTTAKFIHSAFQPTRPLRGATGLFFMRRKAERDFNPRAPCGARL